MSGLSLLRNSRPTPGRTDQALSGSGHRPLLLYRDLYGFVPAAFDDEPGPSLLRRYHCIRCGNIAALAGPPSLHLPVRNRVRHALGKLRTWQRVLEQVMRRTPVLPAHFGSRLPDRATTLRLLRENTGRLEGAINAYGHLRQLEIQISGPRLDPGAGSRLLAAREHIRLELKSLCLAVQEKTALPPGTLLNARVLFRPFDEPRLDAALARLDGEFGGWLHFHCIGPLPPCNFADAAVSRTGAGEWMLKLTAPDPGDLPVLLNGEPAGVRAA